VDRPPSRSSPRGRQARPLLLHPRVHEQEARGHIERTQHRVPRRCAYPAARQQPVARLDPEPQAVLLQHPAERRVGGAAGEEVCDGFVLALPPLGVRDDGVDWEGGRGIRLRAPHSVERRVARPALDERAGAAALPAHDGRHEEPDAPRLQASDDVRREERAVQIEALDLYTLIADETQHLLDDAQLAVRTLDERQRDRHPPSGEDGVRGRVGVEPGGAGLRLPSHNLVFVLPWLPVVRDERVVDGDLQRASGEQARRLLREQPVRPLEERLKREAAEAVSDDALGRGELVLLAYPAGGCLPRRGQREHAGHVARRVLAMEPPAQQPRDPEHRRLGDPLRRDPSRAMVICPASACSPGALPGSVIPSSSHVCTNTGTGGMTPNPFQERNVGGRSRLRQRTTLRTTEIRSLPVSQGWCRAEST